MPMGGFGPSWAHAGAKSDLQPTFLGLCPALIPALIPRKSVIAQNWILPRLQPRVRPWGQ